MRNAGGIDLNEIHSFTDFLRNAKMHTKHLKETGRPSVLTVNGRAELVIQDAKSYQRLLDRSAELEDLRAVQRGLAEMNAGSGRPMEEVFDALDAKYLGQSSKDGST